MIPFVIFKEHFLSGSLQHCDHLVSLFLNGSKTWVLAILLLLAKREIESVCGRVVTCHPFRKPVVPEGTGDSCDTLEDFSSAGSPYSEQA